MMGPFSGRRSANGTWAFAQKRTALQIPVYESRRKPTGDVSLPTFDITGFFGDTGGCWRRVAPPATPLFLPHCHPDRRCEVKRSIAGKGLHPDHAGYYCHIPHNPNIVQCRGMGIA